MDVQFDNQIDMFKYFFGLKQQIDILFISHPAQMIVFSPPPRRRKKIHFND